MAIAYALLKINPLFGQALPHNSGAHLFPPWGEIAHSDYPAIALRHPPFLNLTPKECDICPLKRQWGDDILCQLCLKEFL